MTPPLRITFVAPFGLGQKTTVWARTLPLARYLAGQGHRVSILIPPWDTPADAGKQWHDNGVEVINVAVDGGTLSMVARLLRLIDQQRPHIVHIIKPRAHAGLVQWWLWQRRRLAIGNWRLGRIAYSPITNRQSHCPPKILLDIDDWEQAWAPINRYPWPVARFLAWQEEWGIRHADGITAASHWLEARASQYAPQTPVLYLPNGVDQESADYRLEIGRHASRNTQHAPRLLFFTRFVEVEPDWLAEFWHSFHTQMPNARLIVAGVALQPGRERVFQEQMVHLNPTSADQVEWLGYVSQAQQATLFSSVACAIFPAMNVPLLQAKCSVKLATTLLHGVPVVASAVGEQAAYGAEGAACLVDAAATPIEFAGTVASLLRQPACQQAMVDAARRRLGTTYDWSALGAKLENFYRHWVQS